MAIENEPNHHGAKQNEDVEMADISLLNNPEEDNSTRNSGGEAHSWYSAHGRGFTLHGRQSETQEAPSHIGTVLGEAYYSRERRNQRIWEFWTERPYKAFNISSVVLLVVLLLTLLFSGGRQQETPVEMPAATSDAQYAPEGTVSVDLAHSYDFRGRPREVVSAHAAVAADHSRCSDIGLRLMQVDGGNAVDAAVATALCQGVMSPGASGIGGGAFITVRLPNGTAEVIDARELAPAAANETMFHGDSEASLRGGLAVGVPLELKGLWLAHQRHGNLSWHQLVEPAADLARKGFAAHPYLADQIEANADRLRANPQLRQAFMIADGGSWRAPKVNETCCVRPQLASLLDDVALSGPDALYNTKKAEALASEIQAAGGLITVGDLRSAQPELKPVLNSTVFGLTILAPPPPSSAAVIIAALHILQGYSQPLSFMGPLASHLQVEAMKSAFALRTHLGDPGACSNSSNCFLDLEALLNDTLSLDFADSLREGLQEDGILASSAYGGPVWFANSSVLDDGGTSHISTVDEARMAVAMTTTINLSWGSYVYSQATGILLNNQMDDFSTPGQANVYGLAPSPANFIRPGKKPLSSMSPIILSDSSGLRGVIGASGGPRIVSAVLGILVRIVALAQDPLVAVSSARLHHQLLPDTVAAEEWHTAGANFSTPASTLSALRRRGHNVTATDWGAACQLVVVDSESGSLTSVSDPRKDGAPSGF